MAPPFPLSPQSHSFRPQADYPCAVTPVQLEVASSHESDTAAEIGCFDCSGSGSSLHDFASIASSIPGYVYQNGRRYHPPHRGENYLLPNDERELERLDLLHHLFRLTLDGDLCYARLDHPENILDLGTGALDA